MPLFVPAVVFSMQPCRSHITRRRRILAPPRVTFERACVCCSFAAVVNLYGPEGMGKNTVATALALFMRQRQCFSDGVFAVKVR